MLGFLDRQALHPGFSRGGLDEQIQGGDAITISSGRGEGFDFGVRESLHGVSKLPGVPKFVPKNRPGCWGDAIPVSVLGFTGMLHENIKYIK